MKNINTNFLTKLQKEFGHAGIGYYLELMCILKIKPNHLIDWKEINKIAEEMHISSKKLIKFINICFDIITSDGYRLLNRNNQYFWSDKLLIKDKKNKNRTCTKYSGRKKLTTENCIQIANITNVNLTQEQLDKLNQKYGVLFIKNAINILDKWLERKTQRTKKYLNKNNYPDFRSDSWIIHAAKQLLDNDKPSQIDTPDGVMLIDKGL